MKNRVLLLSFSLCWWGWGFWWMPLRWPTEFAEGWRSAAAYSFPLCFPLWCSAAFWWERIWPAFFPALGSVTTRMLRLPSHLGATVLLSLIGGYPVGLKWWPTCWTGEKLTRLPPGGCFALCKRQPLLSHFRCGNWDADDPSGRVVLSLADLRNVGDWCGGFLGTTASQAQERGTDRIGGLCSRRGGCFLRHDHHVRLCRAVFGATLLLRGRGLSDALADVLHLDPAMVNVFTGLFEVTGAASPPPHWAEKGRSSP